MYILNAATQEELKSSMNLQRAGHLEVMEQEEWPKKWVHAYSYLSHYASWPQLLSSFKFLSLLT